MKLIEVDVEIDDLKAVIGGLFELYPELKDSSVRSIVNDAMLRLFSYDETLISTFADLTAELAERSRLVGVSDLMTVLEWLNSALVYASQNSTNAITSLLQSQGSFLLTILCTSGSEKIQRQIKSCIRSTKGSLVKCLAHSNPDSIKLCDRFLEILLGDTTGIESFICLSVLVDASINLFPSNPGIQYTVGLRKHDIICAYITIILKSKKRYPLAVVTLFDTFLQEFLSDSDFSSDLLPALGEAITLSPTVVLCETVPAVINCLPRSNVLWPSIDLYLIRPLLLHVKSANTESFKNALSCIKCFLIAFHKVKLKWEDFAGDLIIRLESSNELNEELGEILCLMSPSEICSLKIWSELTTILETRDELLGCENVVIALFRHSSFLLQSGALVSNDLVGIVRQGSLSSYKKIFVLALVRFCTDLSTQLDTINGFALQAFPHLLDAWNQVSSSLDEPLQTDNVSIAFALICLARRLHQNETIEKLYGSAPVLRSLETYTSLSSSNDLIWAIKSLDALSCTIFDGQDCSMSRLWADAWIFYVSAAHTLNIQQLARSNLAQIYIENQEKTGPIFTTALHFWVQENSGLQYSCTHLSNVISTLFSKVDKKTNKALLEDNLSKLVLVTHHKKIALKGSWVGLCKRLGVDYKSLVIRKGSDMLLDILEKLGSALLAKDVGMQEAGIAAAVTLASFDGGLISLMLDIIERGLSGVSGETASQTQLNSMETLDKIWGTRTKGVDNLEDNCLLSFGFITALSREAGVFGLDRWYIQTVKAMVYYLTHVGSAAEGSQVKEGSKVFMELSFHISKQLKPLREVIGALVLGTFSISLEERYTQRSDQIALQVLQKVKLVNEKPLDKFTSAYLGPLLFSILKDCTWSQEVRELAFDITSSNHQILTQIWPDESCTQISES